MTSPLSQEAEQVKPTRDTVSRMDGWMNTCTDAWEDGWRCVGGWKEGHMDRQSYIKQLNKKTS